MFISFMIHSGKNKRQTNQRMSKSVINASEVTGVRKFRPELELSFALKMFSFDVWGRRVAGQSERKRQNNLTRWLPDNV